MNSGADVRLVLCDECGSEGRIYTRGIRSYEKDCGQCSRCGGTGMMLVDVEPIAEEDLP